jgi:hypothetical protein
MVLCMRTIDFPTIDLSKIKLPFELPFDLPKIDLTSVEVPTFDFSKLELSDVPSAEQVIEWFRDAVFAGTGLVALTAERVADLQKQFVEFVKAQVKRVQS